MSNLEFHNKEEEHFIEWGDKKVRVSASQKAKWDALWDYWDALAAKMEVPHDTGSREQQEDA